MLRTTLASSRALRVGVLGLVTLTTTILISDSAEARRYRHRHARHHHSQDAGESYGPKFASIVVDGNSGAVLASNSPDGLRHPASLTKMMTLYLLFERLDSGKMKLDTEMPVSEHASEQDPTKLGLRPGQTIRVEDAIKGLITRSANDAAVVIAEAIGGSEDDFARMMTRKARALGMSRTVYRNASGLPNDEQVTTARDQSILGRALQDRFPRYYRYFSTTAFNFRGHTITGHNHLLGSVEGVDGIKTGYIRASGFNLVTSMHRGNRFLIGVVLGGRSGGSRDAIMRNLLAENLPRAATTRTAAAITERNPADANVEVADADDAPRAAESMAAASEPAATAMPAPRPANKPSLMAAAAAALPPLPAKPAPQAKPEPAPLTSGVIQSQAMAAIPGSAEPMKPVKVKTVQVKAGQIKLAAAGPAQSAPPITNTVPSRNEVAETSNAMMTRAANMPPQPANFGTGNGILGVLPASAVQAPTPAAPQAVASIEPAHSQPASKPAAATAHTGWIIQVGALESESEARQRIDLARSSARGMLSKADPFTETVAKGDRKLYRARFAGLERDQAEAVCRTLKRADISCITVRN
ncbi:serine hydrolase [Bradyrhizobium sp. ISRA443]|uniref:serine hydrolase n=1 Tax=unclassified Bradyrhizobium TaxID=2631580 RepID=UPI0024791EA8|nr:MULTISPECIES: serine hydrolase [unclassified Bradyrhizobium]WGR91763.1 serine hydrolase [Bradyrhizobium sp. ISRA435]WGS02118.1 serine hydrolase [Bradyrhizobium sp. ISRA436]WGS09003.1 serine hydrolase [Bradyrhizobium sp. ISRA437]WGS15892.1 serine hydrolase [Bradyrhizobium sp. ISRA443]